MFHINGIHASADVICDSVSSSVKNKTLEICNDSISIGSTMCIMPNAYYSNGVIDGLVMNMPSDKVSPNLMRPDIGCGVMCYKISNKDTPNLGKLDYIIRNSVANTNSRKIKGAIAFNKLFNSRKLTCASMIDMLSGVNSIGTLGSGEHYIELSEYNDGYYLVIHSGSRLFGSQVIKYYTDLFNKSSEDNSSPFGLRFNMLNFVKDVNTLSNYAFCNRGTIANIIMTNMGWRGDMVLDKTHDIIDTKLITGECTLRNGAQSAYAGSKVIIPTNIVDGIIIGTAKDNADRYMNSAPATSGRLYSRMEAKNKFTLEEYTKVMKGIYCNSISENTLSCSPMVYRSLDYIVNATPWISVDKILKPIYVFRPNP